MERGKTRKHHPALSSSNTDYVSDNGHFKSSQSKHIYSLQIPSNVTRISRCFRRTCSDGTFQIIYYQSGVGSRSGVIDRLFGGAFGVGISEVRDDLTVPGSDTD